MRTKAPGEEKRKSHFSQKVNLYKHTRLTFSFLRQRRTRRTFYRHFVIFHSTLALTIALLCPYTKKRRENIANFIFSFLTTDRERLKKNKNIQRIRGNKKMAKAVFLFGRAEPEWKEKTQIARELKIARIYFGIPVYFIGNFLAPDVLSNWFLYKIKSTFLKKEMPLELSAALFFVQNP